MIRDIRHDLQVGADVGADHLADLLIVQIDQSPASKNVRILPEQRRSLPECQADLGVLQCQIIQDEVCDHGHVRSVILLARKRQGVILSNGLHIHVTHVQIRLEQQVGNDHLDDALRRRNGQRRLL